MININWTKEIDDTIYRMEFVNIIDKNYLVKFSATPLDTVEDNTSSSCLVELSSHEIGLCNVHPKETYEFIKCSEVGFTCYAIDFCHNRSSDPEYECISRDIHPIYSIGRYIDRLRGYPIEHDLNGCVVNRESCVVHTNYFAKNEKAVFDFVENIYAQTVNDIRLWESENCPKSTNEADETPPETTDDWDPKTWNGLTFFCGDDIWTDGENIYYSFQSNQYVLDKSTSVWTLKIWNGLTSFNGAYIWTDGENIYYSNGSNNQYILDKSTSTWSKKKWNGLTDLTCFAGHRIWTDGENIYYSNDLDHYVLDKSTSTWQRKSWNGLISINSWNIWTDGDNIYYSNDLEQYVLDKATSTWIEKTWNGSNEFFYGSDTWTDGKNVYYSCGLNQCILDKATSTWIDKRWDNLTDFGGWNIWTDGENVYYSNGTTQYILSGENE